MCSPTWRALDAECSTHEEDALSGNSDYWSARSKVAGNPHRKYSGRGVEAPTRAPRPERRRASRPHHPSIHWISEGDLPVAFRPSAPHKGPRWLTLFVIVAIATVALASSVLATPVFSFVPDDGGPDDQPGQKDLTAQASAFDPAAPNHFFTAWKWDDTSWSGGNTGDGCSLFDTDSDGKVNYAVCATIGGSTPSLISVTVYSCGDKKADRCTNPVLLTTETSGCDITQVAGQFGGTDTQAACDITFLAVEAGAVGLGNATLLNTCSYPSQEPNSDPSDCVLTIANQDVTVSTSSSGTISWTATLSDTATLNPVAATGSVVFKLYSDSGCTNLVWTSAADTSAPFASGTGGTPLDGNIISGTGPTNVTYYWIATYTPTGAFNSDSSACGEGTTIIASVSGSSGN